MSKRKRLAKLEAVIAELFPEGKVTRCIQCKRIVLGDPLYHEYDEGIFYDEHIPDDIPAEEREVILARYKFRNGPYCPACHKEVLQEYHKGVNAYCNAKYRSW